MRAVGVLAAGGVSQGDAADGAAGGWGSGEPAVKAAVMKVMVTAGMHPALALLRFPEANTASMRRGRVRVFCAGGGETME